MRRILAVALLLLSPGSFAQEPPDLTLISPVIALMRQDEAELAAAAKEGDSVRLQLLAWRNRHDAFTQVKSDPPVTPDDPRAVALREAYVACANAHSGVGMLAHIATDAVLTNAGGENTELLNIMRRESVNFFLKPFHEKRALCGQLTGVPLQPAPLGADADSLLPPFEARPAAPFKPAEKEDWRRRLNEFRGLEMSLVRALETKDASFLTTALNPLHAFKRLIARRDDPGLSAGDRRIVKECGWQSSHFTELLGDIQEALSRPEVRANALKGAVQTLEQYRDVKADCARALGAPAAAGVVHLADDVLIRAAQ
jgi:hypothetical protein